VSGTPLLEWQWSDYAAKHRNRANLLIHIGAVPLFELGTLLIVGAAVWRAASVLVLGIVCLGVSLALQGQGHKREADPPAPFDGAGDFIRRLLAEQWITFPRFVLSGGWYRNLRATEGS
jgi:hypothetical protein